MGEIVYRYLVPDLVPITAGGQNLKLMSADVVRYNWIFAVDPDNDSFCALASGLDAKLEDYVAQCTANEQHTAHDHPHANPGIWIHGVIDCQFMRVTVRVNPSYRRAALCIGCRSRVQGTPETDASQPA